METLSEEFARLPDHRRANSSYELADVLRSVFAMFSLKSPSLLAFKELTKQEEKNLEALPPNALLIEMLSQISASHRLKFGRPSRRPTK
jgi:hypothetical protein